jgi:hypothetical protein
VISMPRLGRGAALFQKCGDNTSVAEYSPMRSQVSDLGMIVA